MWDLYARWEEMHPDDDAPLVHSAAIGTIMNATATRTGSGVVGPTGKTVRGTISSCSRRAAHRRINGPWRGVTVGRWGIAVLLATIACDPGITLEPVGWTRATDGYRWETEFEGLQFTITRLGGLVGSSWVSPVLEVVNPTDRPFVVESGVLETNGRHYPIRFSDRDDENWRSAMPHSTARIVLDWNFQQPIVNVFADAALVTLHLRIGTDAKIVRVQFQRK